MTLGTMKAGDIVLADRNGRRFYAVVTERREHELEVEPIDRRVTYHLVKAREVIGIWHKRRAQNGPVVAAVRSTGHSAKRAGTLARSPTPSPTRARRPLRRGTARRAVQTRARLCRRRVRRDHLTNPQMKRS